MEAAAGLVTACMLAENTTANFDSEEGKWEWWIFVIFAVMVLMLFLAVEYRSGCDCQRRSEVDTGPSL